MKSNEKINIRAQVWFTDFAIALFIFSFMLIVYYTYIKDISGQDYLEASDLISDAESLSSSLLLTGFPYEWDITTVQSIGITDNNQRINKTKLLNFEKLNYNRTKKLFGTIYDYFIFFTDENNTVINVEGICGIGNPLVNSTYDIRSAYYYDNAGDAFLKDFMSQELDADIYSAEPGYNDFDALISNIYDYSFAVIEHPLLSTAVFDNNKVELENFVSNKGLLMLSGEIVSGQGKEMVGVKFYKESGQSVSDRNSTVVSEDEFLSFTLGENIIFRQAYYIENQPEAENFSDIAKFNADSKTAVARWAFGDGSAFYFSDFDVSYFDGNFVDDITDAILKWGNFKCKPVDLSNIKYKNFSQKQCLASCRNKKTS